MASAEVKGEKVAHNYMIVGVLSLCIVTSIHGSANDDKKKTSSSSAGLINVEQTSHDKVQSFLVNMFGESYAKRARQHLNNPASKAVLRVVTTYQDPEAFKKDFIQRQKVGMNGNNFFANPSSDIGKKMYENLDVLAKAQAEFSIALLNANEKYEEETMKAAHAMDKDIYDLLNQ